MKAIKVLLLVICGVGASVICFKIANVMGQQQKSTQRQQISSAERSKQMIERRLTRLDKYLKLTPGQKKGIENVMEKSQPEMEKIQEQMKQLQNQLGKIMTRTEEQIKTLLTAEQKKKYEILQELSGGQGGERSGPSGEMGGPGGETGRPRGTGGPNEDIETVP